MYFFPVSSDGRRIEVVFLPGDEDYYSNVISRIRYAKPDYQVAQPEKYDYWGDVLEEYRAFDFGFD